jgi:Phosphodiester glycosidase
LPFRGHAHACLRAASRSALPLLVVACVPVHPAPRASAALPSLRVVADTEAVDTIATGALHWRYVIDRGPWVIHVLDVDRASCWSPVAIKDVDGAEGRARTSAIAESLAVRIPAGQNRPGVAGAVNGDFFLFTPAGLPTGAFVHDGRVVAGPGVRPVFALDASGTPWLGVLRVEGYARVGADSVAIDSWNRLDPAGVAFFDAAYGLRVDTASGSVRIVLDGPHGGRIVRIDTSGGPTLIPPRGSVLAIGAGVVPTVRTSLLRETRLRRRVGALVRLAPLVPREALGGFPVLVRDSAEVAALDSAGAVTFGPARHPRTIVALGAGGRRIMLITVDGRQAGYSAGMTLREAAQLSLSLGATDALNLDGGGSTSMVVAQRTGTTYHYGVVNHPSDATGERPVGNALAIVSSCR